MARNSLAKSSQLVAARRCRCRCRSRSSRHDVQCKQVASSFPSHYSNQELPGATTSQTEQSNAKGRISDLFESVAIGSAAVRPLVSLVAALKLNQCAETQLNLLPKLLARKISRLRVQFALRKSHGNIGQGYV